MSDIKGTNVASPIRPFSTFDKFPTAYQKEIKGGFHSISTMTEIDNELPIERREVGMWIYVLDENQLYKLMDVDLILFEKNGKYTVNEIDTHLDNESIHFKIEDIPKSSTETLGVASFDTNTFTVENGHVTAKAGDVGGVLTNAQATILAALEAAGLVAQGDNNIQLTGGVASESEIQAWTTGSDFNPEIWTSIPKASYIEHGTNPVIPAAFGVAAFDPEHFEVVDGNVTIKTNDVITKETDPEFNAWLDAGGLSFTLEGDVIGNGASPITTTIEKIRGISVTKEVNVSGGPDVLVINSSVAFTGEVIAWANAGSNIGTVFDNIPHAGIFVNTETNTYGITTFYGEHFEIDANDMVSIKLDNIVTEETDPVFTQWLATDYVAPVAETDPHFTAWRDNTYTTANETITLSGDLSGSGTNSIEATVNTIQGFTVTKVDGVNVLLFEGSIAATEEIQAWTNNTGNLPPTFWSAMPIANVWDGITGDNSELRGAASFNSNEFTVINGHVSINGGIGLDEAALLTYLTTNGYLTSYTETDPIFIAWDKSSGISITESQISNFGNYETSISLGTIAQYWRGDKSWQTLNTSVVPEVSNKKYVTDLQRIILEVLDGFGFSEVSGTLLLDGNFAATGEISAYSDGTGGSGSGGLIQNVYSYTNLLAATETTYSDATLTNTMNAYSAFKLRERLDNLEVGGSMVYPSAGIPISTGTAWGTSITNNSSNWNTAYGWGNHASAGYLTTETDPIFTAWDKSTGISITESQISDFGSYETAFAKNTAFNKNFGTIAGTVAQGNDSRINNGQTAYNWGNWATGVNKTFVDNLGVNATTLDNLNNTDFFRDRGALTSSNDLDLIVNNGHYRWTSSAPINAPSLGDNIYYKNLIVRNDGGQPTQMIWGGSGYGKIAIRRRDNGVWKDWTEFYSDKNSNLSTVDWRADRVTATEGFSAKHQHPTSFDDGVNWVGISQIYNNVSSTEVPRTYTQGLNVNFDGTRTWQLVSYYGNANELYFRNRSDSNIWQDWVEIYHSGNSNLSTVPWAASTGTFSGALTSYDLKINAAAVGGDREIEFNRGGSTYGTSVYRDYKIKLNGATSMQFTYKSTASEHTPMEMFYSYGGGYVNISELNVAGALTAASLNATNLSTGYIPYDNGTSLVNSPIYATSATGNVGIGTTSPDELLHLNSASPTLKLQTTTSNGANSGTIQFREFDENFGGFMTFNGSTNLLHIGTRTSGVNNNRISIVRDNGNVLIGTTTDNGSNKLQVNGNIKAKNLLISGATESGIQIEDFYSGTAWRIYAAEDDTQLYLSANGANKVEFDVSAIKFFGNVVATGEVTAYSTSDIRLKQSIIPITNALDSVMRMNPVNFYWNDKAKELNSSKNDNLQYGQIAQELQLTHPELVHPIYNNYLSIDYPQLININTAAIKEIGKVYIPQITKHEEDIIVLKNRVTLLEYQLEQALLNNLKN
jgi:hypothetical protein